MSKRQQARTLRRAAHYDTKLSAATTPADRAAVLLDQIRARLGELPAEHPSWRVVTARIEDLSREFAAN